VVHGLGEHLDDLHLLVGDVDAALEVLGWPGRDRTGDLVTRIEDMQCTQWYLSMAAD